jgi:hypothetical protein
VLDVWYIHKGEQMAKVDFELLAAETEYEAELMESWDDDETPPPIETCHTAAAALRAGRELTKAEREVVSEVLRNRSDMDWVCEDRKTARQWNIMAAALGFVDKIDSASVYSRKPKTCRYNGEEYEALA